MAISGLITVGLNVVETATSDLSSARDAIAQAISVVLSDGTGINACNKRWADSRSLASGVSDNLDLSGSLTNMYGTTVAFTAVKFMFIQNTTALSASYLDIVPGTNGWSSWAAGGGGFNLPSGYSSTSAGAFVLLANCTAAGYSVVAGTGDILKITANDGVVTYNIILIGV